MSHPDFILDKRVLERNVAKGIVKREELEQHLAKLPDVEHNAEPCAPPVPAAAASDA